MSFKPTCISMSTEPAPRQVKPEPGDQTYCIASVTQVRWSRRLECQQQLASQVYVHGHATKAVVSLDIDDTTNKYLGFDNKQKSMLLKSLCLSGYNLFCSHIQINSRR